MVCAGRSSVYAFIIGGIFCAQGIAFACNAKDDGKAEKPISNVNTVPTAEATGFQWDVNRRLSWDDFKGPVNAVSDESAAATHCGIGFRVNTVNGKPAVQVYNTFYMNKSWVRNDAKIASILVHEQGHFDICEIYTRMLKKQMENFDFSVSDVKGALMAIFNSVNSEYEQRQQAYEAETVHGTNFAQQQKWLNIISRELN